MPTLPSLLDYKEAIENPAYGILDEVLKKASPRRGRDSQPLMYSGAFAAVFVFDSLDRRSGYAVRCWTHEIGEDARRYEKVSSYLADAKLPFFTEFDYVAHGIFVEGRRLPILRMDWVEAPSLREFIRQNKDTPKVLLTAAETFLDMARTLHEKKISHGDLQNDNLRVRTRGTGLEFVLIDYDTVCVPELQGTMVTTPGVPAFQHPKRMRMPVAIAEADYFAELVVYLTLHAIADDPKLWDEYHIEDREKELIFTEDDFDSTVPTRTFKRLRNLSDTVSKLTLLLWNYTRQTDIQQLIPLERATHLCGKCDVLRASRSFKDILEEKKQIEEGDWLLERSDEWSLPQVEPPSFEIFIGNALGKNVPNTSQLKTENQPRPQGLDEWLRERIKPTDERLRKSTKPTDEWLRTMVKRSDEWLRKIVQPSQTQPRVGGESQSWGKAFVIVVIGAVLLLIVLLYLFLRR